MGWNFYHPIDYFSDSRLSLSDGCRASTFWKFSSANPSTLVSVIDSTNYEVSTHLDLALSCIHFSPSFFPKVHGRLEGDGPSVFNTCLGLSRWSLEIPCRTWVDCIFLYLSPPSLGQILPLYWGKFFYYKDVIYSPNWDLVYAVWNIIHRHSEKKDVILDILGEDRFQEK